MKRYLLTILLYTTFCTSLSAQWYLFPGKKKAGTIADTTAVTALTVETASVEEATPIQEFVTDIPGQIKISLVLPLAADGLKPRDAMFDFYCGAMIAIKEEAEKGRNIAVNVIDSKGPSADGNMSGILAESDIVLYCADDIERAAKMCSNAGCIVSPLGNGGRDSTIVKLSTHWRNQIDNLTSWLEKDTRQGDEIVLLCEDMGINPSDTLSYIMKTLRDNSLRYRIGQEVNDSTAADIPGTRRFVNVSGSDKYLFRQLQAASVQGERGLDIAFYTTSRVRNLRGIEDSRMLYNAHSRIVAQYAIDYSDEESRNFIRSCREMSRIEPTRFAFHGYDTARYFLKICATYGRNYRLKLTEFPYEGVQSKFVFKEDIGSGMVNTATSRISYEPDLSLTITR